MDQTPLETVRQAIERVTGPGRPAGSGWRLRCPAHPDRDPSLSLGQNADGHALLFCQAGCSTQAVLESVDLGLRDLYPIRPDDRRPDPVIATYPYVDEDGQLLFQVLRTAGKQFRQRRPDPDKPGKWIYRLDQTRRVLYRLPHVLAAIRDGQTVWLVEGEKDVETLEQHGQVATTCPGGAGKWRPEYTEMLRGAHLNIVADMDTHGAGLRHARTVALALGTVAASLTLLAPAAGKDTTDHLLAGVELDSMNILPITAPDGASSLAPEVTGPVSGPPEQSPVSPAEAPVNPLRLTPASEFKIKPVRWLWADRMPLGEITLVPGREGIGKSTFLAWMASAITNGNLPGEYHGKPRAVLYAASEDAWGYTIAPRMLAAGANLELVYRVDVVGDEGPGRLNLPAHCRHLPEVAAGVDAAILMCDPIVSLVHDSININRAQELRNALEPLRHAAEVGGFAVAALVHFNKTRDTDLLSMVAGSRAWVEVARAVIAIARDDEADVNIVSQRKNNLGRTDLPNLTYTMATVELETEDGAPAVVGRLVWGEDTDVSAEEVLQRRPAPRNSSTGDNTRQILDWIGEQGHGVTARDVISEFDGRISASTIKSILSRSVARGELTRPTGGLYVIPVTQLHLGDTNSTESRDFHARARAGARPGATQLQLQPNATPKSEYMEGGLQAVAVAFGGGQDSTDDVARGETQGVVAVAVAGGATRVQPPMQLIQCRRCFGPLYDTGEGYDTHPGCE